MENEKKFPGFRTTPLPYALQHFEKIEPNRFGSNPEPKPQSDALSFFENESNVRHSLDGKAVVLQYEGQNLNDGIKKVMQRIRDQQNKHLGHNT